MAMEPFITTKVENIADIGLIIKCKAMEFCIILMAESLIKDNGIMIHFMERESYITKNLFKLFNSTIMNLLANVNLKNVGFIMMAGSKKIKNVEKTLIKLEEDKRKSNGNTSEYLCLLSSY